MSNSTRRFVVLSQGINTSDDVFNALIEVQDKDTCEIGTLLCSHMCNWPSELISQATWLEGCKTPELYKDEPRLALGYHPQQYTQWRVFKETNEIEIYLTGSWHNPDGNNHQEAEDSEEDWLHVNLPYHGSFLGERQTIPQCLTRLKASLVRLCRRVLTPDITQETLNNFESLLHRLFNSGRVDGWEAAVLPSLLIRGTESIHWEGEQDMFLPSGFYPFLDGGIGSGEAVALPYLARDGLLKVNHSVPDAGFYPAVSFFVEYRGDVDIVHYCNPEELIVDE